MTTRWTTPQQSAIDHVHGDLLVSAAAGSGKTAVLAERCARLVCETSREEGGCGVDGLLVLTFTEASANEMRGRIAEAIRQKLKNSPRRDVENNRWLRRQAAMVDRASISTLHGFCARILRQHFHEAQIDPAFEVIDEDEARLMREDVLTELLATWHKPATQSPIAQNSGLKTQDFLNFLESYAQGRESTCRDLILRVYRMLSSTADPAGYVAAARDLYSKDGCPKTLDRFIRQTIGGQLRLFSLTARRSVDDINKVVGPGDMLIEMTRASTLIDWAIGELEAKGAAALPTVRTAFTYRWPNCKTLKDVPTFDSLKKRTWEAVKEKMKALCNNELATDSFGLLQDLATLATPLDTLLALVDDFIGSYTSAKRAQNRLDFSDLERLTLTLLTTPGNLAAAELRARYHHLLVDEFQDINPLQATLLETLRSPERFGGAGNLFVVGDVKQSIYGFRLAEPALFLERENAARLATTTTAQRYVGLPHNFRSHPNLLAAMNGLFEKILTRAVTGITYTDGHALEAPPSASAATSADALALVGMPVELHLVVMQQQEDDEENGDSGEDTAQTLPQENLTAIEEEARMVADRIAAIMREHRTITPKNAEQRELKYRDIAILLRSMKDKAMIFARALASRGIPVHADLSTGYFDTAEVRDTLALLQVIDNPQQDIPLATALLGPYGHFSHDDIATIRLTYDRKTVSFPDAVIRYALTPSTSSTELPARLAAFLEKIAGWRSRLRTRPLHEGLAEIFADSKILPTLAGTTAGSQRVANLQRVHQRALKFAGFRKQGLHRFLRFIEKLRDQDGDFGEAPVLSEASDVVRIMSVHKSKGLEFPVVFVSGLGSFLNLIDIGPVFVHRDLGIGLQVADVDRNIFYHSAASSCITDSNKRTGRAEELRLLYVALTRARDHLILTGHINKTAELDQARDAWCDHSGELPEDVLLKGRTFMQWLLPALACSDLKVQWPGEDLGAAAQVAITLHPATGNIAVTPTAEAAPQDDIVRRLIAAEPLPESPADVPMNASVDRLITRVTGKYAHAALAAQPAVMSVTALKNLTDAEAVSPEEMPAATLPIARLGTTANPRALEARLRGIATHRILELLDFSNCQTPAAIADSVAQLVAANLLTPEDAALADLPGITWFLTQSAAGKRLLAAAAAKVAGNTAIHIRREIPFAWAAPTSSKNSSIDPADWPTIRGVIDLLLVDTAARTAEISDYKTDSAFTWQEKAPAYHEQMGYYLKAATDILGFPVASATLLFLSPQEEKHVAIT